MASSNWNGPWVASKFCAGNGYIVDLLVESVRVHSVFVHLPSGCSVDQADCLPTRFYVAVGTVSTVEERVFGSDGDELDYVVNEGRKGSKSHVNLKTLSNSELATSLSPSNKEVPMIDDLLEPAQLRAIHPQTPNVFEFWIDDALKGAREVAAGDKLRIFTRGNSIFVQKFIVLNAKPVDAVTGGWGKAMHQYKEEEEQVNKYLNLKHETEVDEDEWDD